MLAASPNPAALALSPLVGWLLLVCGIAGGILAIVGREGWRRWWLGLEDPRPLALFRVIFALIILVDIDSLGGDLPFLFSDEGLFAADGLEALLGPASERPLFGLVHQSRFSLLYRWDSPTALWIHLAAFNLAGVLLAIGLWTRASAIACFGLFVSFLSRDEIFWEGTELILRCLFFYLVLARSGQALSVDNWLRCRRLRRAGRLSLPGLPGEGAGAPPSAAHPAGLEAIYRRIPAWPRRLMILQIAALYLTTGAVKNGDVWAAGDALYYALLLDHFYRVYPQALAAALGTNLFRVMTWVTRAWEILFPLVIVGMVIRWRWREGLALVGRAWTIAALAWIGLGLGALAILVVALPVHLPPSLSEAQVRGIQGAAALAWLAGMAAIAGLRRRLARGPLRLGPWTIDRETLVAWTLGRRIWLTLGIVFHLHLMILMSIGAFQPIMLAATLLFLDADEVRWILARLRLRGAAAPPPEDPALPRLARDPTPLPWRALAAALALATLGVVVEVASEGRIAWRWFGAAILGGLVLLVLRGRGRTPIDAPPGAPPLAFGPLGRLAVGAIILVQIVGVALWLVPDKAICASWRGPARRALQPWLALTQTTQGWGMFAPNPPTGNVFLKIEVTRPSGEVVDLRTDVYAREQMPIPYLGYDRMRKVNRRVLTEGARFRPWVARYWCRRWAREHGGELPKEVRLLRLGYPIPRPEELAQSGPYDPHERLRTHGSEHLVHREPCAPSEAPAGGEGRPLAAPGGERRSAPRPLSD